MQQIMILNSLWDVKQVEPNDSLLLVGEQRCRGVTHYYHHLIVLDKTMRDDEKEATLRHELTHAYIKETQINVTKQEYSEEELCEFMGIYGELIYTQAKSVMYFFKKEDK